MTTAELAHEQRTDQMTRHLVAGRYRLLARIGRGRMGDIYEADDEGHRSLGVEQRVAIQLLPDRIALDRRLFEKLTLGYTVLRATPHPNIVPILDFDHDGKFGYLATDILEGASLRFILDDCTTLDLDDAIPVIRAVGDALQFLHANSVVHGRLTAENVFITENLEVRLLDVVPLDSAATILRGVASWDPFSRSDVTDDVYGLACLAYEMLAGKHPFNFHTQSNARHTGLEPARIDSLPGIQWNALCHALLFDCEQRTPAVADFLREFGVKGTERLRLSEDAAAKHDFSPSLPANEVPPTTHSAGSSSSSPASAPVAPTTRTVAVARSADALELARAKGERSRRMPLLILVMVLVGLGAWYFFGQPRDDVAWLIDYDGKSAEGDNGALPINAGDITPTASVNTESTNILSATETHSVAENGARAEETGRSLVGGDAASSEVTVGATEEAATDPANEQNEQSAETATDTPQSNDDAATDELANTSDIDTSSQSEPEPTLIQSVVYVSERDGAARISIQHPEIVAGQIFWWTDDNTAIAEMDYIPTTQPVAGEEAEMLYIPLVNDSLPEPNETFYVYLGRHNIQLGRLETIARIRVEINDDD